MAVEMVYVKHPEVDAIGYVVRASFDALWKDKGWEIATEDDYRIVFDDEGGAQAVPKGAERTEATDLAGQTVAVWSTPERPAGPPLTASTPPPAPVATRPAATREA